jgi:hypothetical protein
MHRRGLPERASGYVCEGVYAIEGLLLGKWTFLLKWEAVVWLVVLSSQLDFSSLL